MKKLVFLLLLASACHPKTAETDMHPKQEHDKKGIIWPRVVAFPSYVQGGAPDNVAKVVLENGQVPTTELDGLVIRELRKQLKAVKTRQEKAGTFTGKIYILEDKHCTLWLSQQIVETARQSGYEDLDVVVNEDSPTPI
jgi:hypothetical protein